jgi:hypothetical protein
MSKLRTVLKQELDRQNWNRFKFDLLICILDVLAVLYIATWIWFGLLKQ